MYVGNDIVDLVEALVSCKTQDERFLNRVFTPEEKKIIANAPSPEHMLWAIWAAKETAYKIVSKIIGTPIFSHKAFIVSLTPSVSSPKGVPYDVQELRLSVNYDEFSIPIVIAWDNEKLVATAVYPEGLLSAAIFGARKIEKNELEFWENPKNLDKYFTQEEREGIWHEYSAAVRHDVKKKISELINEDILNIEIIRETKEKKMQPPLVRIKKHLSRIDVSLSHHGQWIAWGVSNKDVCDYPFQNLRL
ncbi:MAG TPA: 4'-phosphopantetheinyl transferase superfamily protein [Gammaproteobacteria bacterium]|nr:4'-phosphopantetheinyl transferase superfamily protein [Gammaproteobacteria bacterium]